ncbi:hypothetical protein K9B33_20800 [Sphingobium sp. 3R8]|uniref:hypothetical protein n=1 Tax=Sphingobium sp. 3R8 TaxID=2874921 RepID=UPI001CCF5091|nr:hypothetical protein [Sphingobium sp. 3R8]MBZ9649977.1 hypothetical protein [Sphingobium sp. 3R8]
MQTDEPNDSFMLWLQRQVSRDDWVGVLAALVRSTPGLRSSGTPEELRVRLQEAGVGPEYFEGLDEAENAWLSE